MTLGHVFPDETWDVSYHKRNILCFANLTSATYKFNFVKLVEANTFKSMK